MFLPWLSEDVAELIKKNGFILIQQEAYDDLFQFYNDNINKNNYYRDYYLKNRERKLSIQKNYYQKNKLKYRNNLIPASSE